MKSAGDGKATIETAKEALKEADKYTEESGKECSSSRSRKSSDKFDIAALVEEKGRQKKPAPDKDALKTAIETAKEALKEEDKYTEESVKALKDVVAEAEKVMADEKATQEAVDAAVKEVADAVAGLAENCSRNQKQIRQRMKAVLADAKLRKQQKGVLINGSRCHTEESLKKTSAERRRNLGRGRM